MTDPQIKELVEQLRSRAWEHRHHRQLREKAATTIVSLSEAKERLEKERDEANRASNQELTRFAAEAARLVGETTAANERSESLQTALTEAERERGVFEENIAYLLDNTLKGTGCVVRVCESNGPESLVQSLAVTVSKMATALSQAQAAAEERMEVLKASTALENLGYNLCYAEMCGGRDESGVAVEDYQRSITAIRVRIDAALSAPQQPEREQ